VEVFCDVGFERGMSHDERGRERVVAEAATTCQLHIESHISSVSEERLSMIAAKATQMMAILKAYWHFA
jgi:hypothetical protein